MSMQLPGGFVQSGLLSPPSSSSTGATLLPQPRSHPLKAGGNKESSFIRHVDQEILHIQRRFAKRSAQSGVVDNARGYESFKEASRDFERLLNLIWVSGTPSIQIPYLLSLALLVVTFLPGFPPSPKCTFSLLRKFDFTFASLLQGRDVETGEPLSGFTSGMHISGTEKVRIKGIIERTRTCVVGVMTDGDVEEPEDDHTGSVSSSISIDEGDAVDYDQTDNWDMEIAQVYDLTMVELGDILGE